MNDIYSINKQINEKTGADTGGATTFELVKAQVAKLGGDTSKVVDIYTGEQQVLEHIKPAGPDVVIQTSKDVSISANGTTVVSPDEGYDAIKDVVVDVNVPSKPEQNKSVTITENGMTSVLPDEGSVLNKVDVTVNVAGGVGASVFHGSNPKFSSIEGDFPNAIFPDLTSCRTMFSGSTELSTVALFDTSNVTAMNSMFYNCSSLQTVPLFDTSNVTTMSHMFCMCYKLTSVPLLNTSNVTNMNNMLYSCSSLTTVPQFDTSNVTNMSGMFNMCSSLTTVPLFDTSNVTDIDYRTFSDCNSLTNFGGLLNIGQAYASTFTYDLSYSPKLSDESIQNVIDGLYDMTAKGFSPTLKFHSTVYAKLTDAQKAQITAKNWTVTA